METLKVFLRCGQTLAAPDNLIDVVMALTLTSLQIPYGFYASIHQTSGVYWLWSFEPKLLRREKGRAKSQNSRSIDQVLSLARYEERRRWPP